MAWFIAKAMETLPLWSE